jgi:thioester reductase-like protein
MNKKGIADIYPLSPTQQGILFQSLADQGTGIHLEQLVVQVQGQVDRSAFEAAWKTVIDRHALLRTGFVWKSMSEPLQVVFKQAPLPLVWEDWTGLSPAEREAKLNGYLLSDRQLGFDLSRPPLLRLALFRVEPERFQLVWSHNHILMDGWCGPVLIQEFLALYQAYRAGENINLPAGRPYKDYIKWLKSREPAEAEAFWRERLGGLSGPTPPGIPADPLPETEQVERYGDRRASLPEETASRLKAAAQARRLTLNTLVQGAWALLLARYAAGDRTSGAAGEVIFGTTVSGRPPDLPGSETTIGLFINTLPVRAKVTPQAGLWDWLAGLQAASFELSQYEYTPGPLVHRWSGLPGNLPLYESLLVFENYPLEVPDFSASGLSIDLRTARSEGARTGFPLTLLVVENAGLEIQLVHDLRRISASDAERILSHLQVVLEEVAAGEERKLGEILERIPVEEAPLYRALPARARLAAGTSYSPPRSQLEAHLAAIWADILGVERVGIFDSFFDLGGHSLLAIQLYYAVREAYPVDLPLLRLFEEPNVAHLAETIEAAYRGEAAPRPVPRLDLASEARLDPGILPRARERTLPADPRRVFLTGATGFLGAYLLHELLSQTRAEIHCLVRAKDPQDGLGRIQRALEPHGLWRQEHAARLVPVPGDLASPHLGLSEAQFEALAGSTDAIYHNGAWVTYLYPYPALKAANVFGTQEVLRLACLGGAIPVHYVSSLAVFPLALDREPYPAGEGDEPADWQDLFGGYAQSKWVAEQLALQASRRGLPVSVYRPGLVTGHSQTGRGSTDDMLALLVKGCIQLGALPQVDTLVDMTPVDYVSRALVQLSRQPGAAGQIYHLANPAPAAWPEVAGWIRDYGFPLEPLPYEAWRARLEGPDGPRSDNALFPLLPLLSEREPSGQPLLARARMPLYRSDQTQARLQGSGHACPPLDRALVFTYLDHFVRTGFILEPESARLEAGR